MKTLYLSDLDGTLAGADERVSEYTKNVINDFLAGGGLFSYATARSIVTASKVTEGLDLHLPVICGNGTSIIDPRTKENLLIQSFEPNEGQDILNTIIDHGINPIVFTRINGHEKISFIDQDMSGGKKFYFDKRLGDPRLRKIKNIEDLFCGDLYLFYCLEDEKELLKPLYNIFKNDGRIDCIFGKDIYYPTWQLELLPAKATKANAALELKKMLGCDRLVVFGDGMNDLSMFAVADESYAMANATPELKEIATGIIGSNVYNAVAKWFENMLAK